MGIESLKAIAHRHRQFGWWSLLVFLLLGAGLELLHAFKAGYYLDVSNDTRRLLWILAHAHGALLALINLAYAASSSAETLNQKWWVRGSTPLVVASLTLPAGFFLGGLVIHGSDPGLGILLVPVGAVALLYAVLCAALAQSSKQP